MSWTTSSWTVQKFTSLECRDKCHVLKAPMMNLLYDWCWPCFYIVFISTSTTKCFFSPVSLLATDHKKSCQMHECLERLHFGQSSDSTSLHAWHLGGGGRGDGVVVRGQHISLQWFNIHSNFSTSQLHVKYVPFLSGIPLRQRLCRCEPNNIR